MSNQLLQKLEDKVNHALEVIELLRMQVEELEAVNANLKTENADLKSRQLLWEQSLSALLRKLSHVDNRAASMDQALSHSESEDERQSEEMIA